jgi:hypothetical protein
MKPYRVYLDYITAFNSTQKLRALLNETWGFNIQDYKMDGEGK